MKIHRRDIFDIENHKLSVDKIERDINYLKKGFPNLEVVRPATLNDGIITFSPEEEETLIEIYQNSKVKAIKFVPASGAASRMFRSLHQFMDEYPATQMDFETFLHQDHYKDLLGFFDTIENLPFYDDLKFALAGEGIDFDTLSQGDKALRFTKQMLTSKGFQMANLPKGLIPFHKYTEEKLTAFQEHLFEAAKYVAKDKEARVHFTISKDHLDKFQEKLKKIRPSIEETTGVNFTVEFSFQNPSTDTVCLNTDGDLCRDEKGHVLFRPAGHGALIQNLNALEADLVFVKNIDNVAHQDSKDEKSRPTHRYKSVLAGKLIQLQNKAFEHLEGLEKEACVEDTVKEAKEFLRDQLNIHIELQTKEDVFYYLNRPIRVCGMVINEGAPGGGPFWIRNEDNSLSLQIVEKSQIDLSQPNQKEKMEASTHFNPVDIVCSFKNYRGKIFNLQDFVDTNKGFVADKFVGGEAIKGLELPGLWNGGMAFWNTVFVEVPSHTFTPVKTISDLLKPEHQPEKNVQ
jgi:hypothetical protein